MARYARFGIAVSMLLALGAAGIGCSSSSGPSSDNDSGSPSEGGTTMEGGAGAADGSDSATVFEDAAADASPAGDAGVAEASPTDAPEGDDSSASTPDADATTFPGNDATPPSDASPTDTGADLTVSGEPDGSFGDGGTSGISSEDGGADAEGADTGTDSTIAAGFPAITAISAGDGLTCVLLANGTVYCWGSDPSTAVQVTGLTGVTAISAGYFSACALLTNGTVECWGDNTYGELGNGTTTNSSTPAEVSGLTGATAISVGDDFACALLANGTLECWGNNEHGQLGNSNVAGTFVTPAEVPGLTAVTAISAGDWSACALLTNGTVECWGDNSFGELGNGTTTDSSTPVAVSGLTGVTAIAAGQASCALLANGTVECWGDNDWGGLGNGAATGPETCDYGSWCSTTPVAVTGLTGVAAISEGDNTACALLTDGTVDCWGYNTYGQLGNGTTTDSSTPVVVTGLTGVAAISAGQDTTYALLSSGTIYVWGEYAIQLGNGYENNSSTPVVVEFPPDAISVSPAEVVSYTDCAGDAAVPSQSLTISNTGYSDVTWTASGTMGFGVAPTAGTLGLGGSVVLQVASPPLSAPPTSQQAAMGNITIQATFTDDAGVPLDAATGQTVVVQTVESVNGCFITNTPPATMSFGTVAVGQAAYLTLPDPSETCEGQQATAELGGGNGSTFLVVGKNPPGGGSGETWTIEFAPRATGLQSATFGFALVGGGGGPICGPSNLTFTASGTGQ